MHALSFLSFSLSVFLSASLSGPQNSENLLLFAAGNDGETDPKTVPCTIGSPAIAKNVLTVGATSAGETRLNSGEIYDIDRVSTFSSWGFTTDGRIKPEVVAPGDKVSDNSSSTTQVGADRAFFCPNTSKGRTLVIN